MKTIEFSIKTITPTLMGGGFGQNDGIRPSEIKGMMRYWFRAVAGSVIGDNLEALKDLENQIFGSQERKSPFRIIVEKEKIEYMYPTNEEYSSNEFGGLIYLGIGNVIFKYSHKIKINNQDVYIFKINDEKISIIAPSSKFKVKFLFRNSIKEETIKLVAYSFYLATALGGFGLRARRGFGSWQIEDVKVENISSNLDNLKNYGLEEENREYIKNKIQEIKNLIKEKEILNIREENRNQEFKTINGGYIYIYSLGRTSWKDALEKLGEEYRKYRTDNMPTTPEYFNVRNFLRYKCKWEEIKQKIKIKEEEKENKWNFAFGLPILLNSKGSTRISIKKLLNIRESKPLNVGSFKVKHGNNYLERLPSTVWFSIKRDLEDNYFVILTYLEGKVFPNEENDEVFFIFSDSLIKELKSKRICNNPPDKIKVEYNAEDLKDKAKNFVIRGLNNG